MAPVFNTTAVCDTTEVCANALDIVQERLDDARRLSHILASLFGIVFLLFICSPLIFNLPRERNDYARRAPPPLEDEGIQMQDFERRDIPEPDEFAIDSEEDEPSNPSQSTLPDSSHFRTVTVGGETFHVAKSDATLLAETGVFRGAGDERQLAQRCVEEAQPKSVASSPVLPSHSYSAEGEGGHENSPHERIGTAV